MKLLTTCLVITLIVGCALCNHAIDLTGQIGKQYGNLEVKVGEKIDVQLKESPSTGFRWMILDEDLAKNELASVIKLSDSHFEANDNRRGMMGVPGIRTLQFEVIGSGKGTLNLFNARQWELEDLMNRNEDISIYISKTINIIAS